MTQRRVGVRDAKTHLSKLLLDIQDGAEVVITDHGKPVAKLVPLSSASLTVEEWLRKLEQSGWIEPVKRERWRKPPPRLTHALIHLPDEMAQRFLQEDRGS